MGNPLGSIGRLSLLALSGAGKSSCNLLNLSREVCTNETVESVLLLLQLFRNVGVDLDYAGCELIYYCSTLFLVLLRD
jgi:hypothetical protein